MWREEDREIEYSSNLELDMGTVEPALAGPKRPQDRILLSEAKTAFATTLAEMTRNRPGAAVERFEGEGGDGSVGNPATAPAPGTPPIRPTCCACCSPSAACGSWCP